MERQKVTKTHPDRKILSYLCIKPTRMKTRNTITVQPYTSPCGRLLLGSFNDKLCLCDWQVEKHRERVNERLKRILRADFKEGVSELTARAARQLDEYFTGKRRTFDIPLLFTGTDFQQKCGTNCSTSLSGQQSLTERWHDASTCLRQCVP